MRNSMVKVDSLLLESTSGRITLEIVGLSDYTEFGQASIDKYEDGNMADGYFFIILIEMKCNMV